MELAELVSVQFYSITQKEAGVREGFPEGLVPSAKDFEIYV